MQGDIMKNLLIFTSIFLIALTYFGYSQKKADSNEKCGCQFIEAGIKDIDNVKIGMTRKNLLKTFEEEGGISTRTQRQYVYRKCPYIKVDIKFEPVGNVKDNLTESPDDKIIEISKPYLQYAIMD